MKKVSITDEQFESLNSSVPVYEGLSLKLLELEADLEKQKHDICRLQRRDIVCECSICVLCILIIVLCSLLMR